MVASTTQRSPLQNHSKTLSALTPSLKSNSRIQSEVEMEGFEVHKENLLSLSLSRKSKSGEQLESSVPSSHTPTKTKMGGASDPSIRAASSSLFSLHPLIMGEETKNAYKLYSDMFPQAYTPSSACLTTTSLHQKQQYSLRPCLMAEHVEVGKSLSIVGNIEADAGDAADNVKRLKYSSVGEDGASMGSFNVQQSEQGPMSYRALDGRRMRVAQDVASYACIGEMGVFDRDAKSRGCIATSCGTSISGESTEALRTTGSKLFTTAVNVQMPNALSTFSEGEPSLPLTLENSQQQPSSRILKTPLYNECYGDADWGKFLALSATPVANDGASNAKVFPFQQRFKQLQAFLKQCDGTGQNVCLHALRSLSAAARSGHAVELETRAIRLSLEEGKEMKRMRLLNVLGKISEQGLDDAGTTPQGPRLPAPGIVVKCNSVPQ